jgi:hypothetical protein
MDDISSWPVDLMREIANTLNTETDHLLNEHTQRWQQIQQTCAALPASMQESLTTFATSLENHLAGGLTLRGHIGQNLTLSANLAEATDTSIQRSFE